MGLPIEILRQGAEPFLTSSIPNFDRKGMVIHLKLGGDVVNAYGFNMVDVDLTTVIHF